MRNVKTTSFSLTEELFERWLKLIEKEDRPGSTILARLIRAECDRQGVSETKQRN